MFKVVVVTLMVFMVVALCGGLFFLWNLVLYWRTNKQYMYGYGPWDALNKASLEIRQERLDRTARRKRARRPPAD